MPSVDEVAQMAGVSKAAVRARLADGSLSGRQEAWGKRAVWVVDAASAERYAASHRGAGAKSLNKPVLRSVGVTEPRAAGAGRGATKSPRRAPEPESVRRREQAPPRSLEVANSALLEENARLRRALAALTRAHEALVELVDLAFAATPSS